jgi:hypothetical protein
MSKSVAALLAEDRAQRAAAPPMGGPTAHPTTATVPAVEVIADPEVRVRAEMTRQRVRAEARRRLKAEERVGVPEPEILSLRERLARPRQPMSYRIEGWQGRKARVIVSAQYKAGKTTLIGTVVRCLVDGGLFLGVAPVTPVTGTVVLIDTEMSTGQLEDWLAAQRIRHDDRVVVIPMRGRVASFNILDPDVRREWATRLRLLRAEYLILD